MKINFHNGDLPESFIAANIVALDSETMGLNIKRDKLCLVQISNGNEICHLIKLDLSNQKPVNLIKILKNKKIQKIFHYAVCWVEATIRVLKNLLSFIQCYTKIVLKLFKTQPQVPL